MQESLGADGLKKDVKEYYTDVFARKRWAHNRLMEKAISAITEEQNLRWNRSVTGRNTFKANDGKEFDSVAAAIDSLPHDVRGQGKQKITITHTDFRSDKFNVNKVIDIAVKGTDIDVNYKDFEHGSKLTSKQIRELAKKFEETAKALNKELGEEVVQPFKLKIKRRIVKRKKDV